MTSQLRYARKTLLGPWMILAALGIEVTNFMLRGMPWRGEGLWSVDWFAISLFIIGPLAAGVAAIDAARLSRPGNLHLVVSVARRGRAYLWAAAWCAIPLSVLHLAVIGAAMIVGRVGHPSVSWWSLLGAALVQCAGIVWYVCLGSAVGRYTNTLVAGLVGGVGGFALSYLVGGAFDSKPTFQLLNLGSATITMVGKSFNAGYLSAQAVLLLGTGALLLTLRVQGRSGRRLPTGAAAVAAVLVVAAIAIAPTALPSQRYDSTPHAPTSCTGTAPQICLYPEHRRYAAAINNSIDTLAKAAQAHGYSRLVPARIIEESRSYHPSGPGVFALYLPAQVYEGGQFTVQDAATAMLTPSHCAFVQNPSVGGIDVDRFTANYFSLVTTWLHLAGVDDVMTPVPVRLLTPKQADTVLNDFAGCRLDASL
ncbi:hypothetical protein [Krasilnikovia sp. MM14-A1259]|uniref:hypothetical protein n=1 Tax=Krasilnikovia sp. MM14-A1259 TaxID=3373539 RepID=UPI00380AF1DC